MMTTNCSEVFNSVFKGTRNVPTTACVQLTLYRVNDYFILRQKAATIEDVGRGCIIAAKLLVYGTRANKHATRVFNI